MDTETLRAELERLFELDELLHFSSDVLQLDPAHVGSTTTLASFVSALVECCAREHTLLALSDAVLVCKPDARPELLTHAAGALLDLPELRPGDLYQDFVVARSLGKGPSGACFLATRGDVEYRLKIVSDGVIPGRAALQRFLTYCRLVARHAFAGMPAELEAHKRGEHLLVQHLYRAGETLGVRILRTGPQRLSELRPVLEAVLESLARLHQARLAHGNLRPGNVLVLTSKPNKHDVWLLDPGFDRLRPSVALSPMLNGSVGPCWAPEQIRGYASDPRSDVYAFGALCYELVAGVAPFASPSSFESALAHLTEEPEPPSRLARHNWIDSELDAFLLGLLAKDPSQRPADAKSVLEELRRLERGSGRPVDADPQATLRTLLDQLRNTEMGPVRAQLLAQVARVHELSLGNRAQALLTLAEAFCEAPQHSQYADEIERLAGSDEEAYKSVLRTCAQAVLPQAVDVEAEYALLLRMGRWYEYKLDRYDLALPCYQSVLAKDPTRDGALEGAARVQRKLQNWSELAAVLLQRAEHTKLPARARDLRVEAAEVLESCLHDSERAKSLYEQVLFEDPSHAQAGDALAVMCEKAGDPGAHERLLELRARSARGSERRRLLQRLAELRAGALGNVPAAAATYEQILSENPGDQSALLGLEQLLGQSGLRGDLAHNLETQLENASTPRQRIELLRRLSRLYSDEYLDRERAAAALREIIAIDANDTVAWLGLAETLDQHLARPEDALTAYQNVLELQPGHAAALAAVARLQEARGDLDHAMQAYELAIEADPQSTALYPALRRLYLKTGDDHAALQVLECEVELAQGERAKAKLLGQVATLAYDLDDVERAERAAKRAFENDASNLDALLILGELAFDGERYAEASTRYEPLVERLQSLDPAVATRILVRFIEALYRTEATEKALAAQELLTAVAPDDPAAWLWVADVTFQFASLDIAAELYAGVLADFSSRLSNAERASCLYRYGEALRQTGRFEEAIGALEAAADLEPGDPSPLAALAEVHAAREAWEEVVKVKTRELDVADGATRLRLLLEIGDLAKEKLDDPALAVKSFALALEEQPSDRRLLTKLMQLYSDDKDWPRLVEVVLRLAEFVDDPAHRTKYLHTAAIVTSRQLGDTERAIELYELVLELDPAHDKANRELSLLQHARGNYAAVEALLERRLERARATADLATEAAALDELAKLYEAHLGSAERAIEAYEAAHTLDPRDRARLDLLAELYAANPEQHFEKGVTLLGRLLRDDPYRPGYYRQLRSIYAAARKPDGAFCACQALTVLNLAEPDEERFFMRFRSETPAFGAPSLNEAEWSHAILHPRAALALTRVLGALEPAILARDTRSLESSIENLGYIPEEADPFSEPPLMRRSIDRSAALLGLPAPPIFRDPSPNKGLSFLHARPPGIVLGEAAIVADLPAQAAAFIAARHMQYFQKGLYLRQRMASLLDLKGWVYAALRLCGAKLEPPAELLSTLEEISRGLAEQLSAEQRSELEQAVSRFVESGTDADPKPWVQGVDLTADRAGLVVSDDLETALEIIRASDEHSSAVPIAERQSELVLYAVSEPYLALRRRLGIAVGM